MNGECERWSGRLGKMDMAPSPIRELVAVALQELADGDKRCVLRVCEQCKNQLLKSGHKVVSFLILYLFTEALSKKLNKQKS